MVANRHDDGLKCQTCENGPVPVTSEIEDAWEVFRLCDTQWKTAGMEGVPVALDFGVVFRWIDELGITNREQVLRQVKKMEHFYLTEKHAEHKRRQDQGSDNSKTIGGGQKTI